jgi:DNA-binding MarR family transcriptional regulator
MAVSPDKTRIYVTVTKKQKKEIERMSKKLDLPPATFATNLLTAGLDDARILDRLGFLKGAQVVSNFAGRHTALRVAAMSGEPMTP